MTPTIIAAEHVITPMDMKCGFTEAQQNRYHIHRRGKEVFLWADVPNAGDYVYWGKEDENTGGFGGSKLTFLLVEGGSVDLLGPWHSNDQSLKERTGVDLSEQHVTWGIVALGREWRGNRDVMKDVLYIDREPVVGRFKRVDDIAQDFANKLGREVAYYSQSNGGSCLGYKEPKTKVKVVKK